MYTSSNCPITQARIAGRHRPAPRDALARQVRQGRRPHQHPAGAAAAGLALVWALAACGAAHANQARPLSPQHVLQAGSQSQISDLANLKRDHTGARPSRPGSPHGAPGLAAVQDLTTVKREAMLAAAARARTR
jgi:hypothetical protein